MYRPNKVSTSCKRRVTGSGVRMIDPWLAQSSEKRGHFGDISCVENSNSWLVVNVIFQRRGLSRRWSPTSAKTLPLGLDGSLCRDEHRAMICLCDNVATLQPWPLRVVATAAQSTVTASQKARIQLPPDPQICSTVCYRVLVVTHDTNYCYLKFFDFLPTTETP